MSSKKPPKPPAPASVESLPPSPSSPDLAQKLSDGLQAQALSMIEGLEILLEQRPADEHPQWQEHRRALQRLLKDLHGSSASQPPPDEDVPTREGGLDPAQAAAFGKTLERLRDNAKLSRGELAKRANLARGTIHNLEQGKTNPSSATLKQLLAVPELGLSAADIPWRPLEGELASTPNCWIAPGYDPIRMFIDLITMLNGQGGSIEQTYAYLDTKSALNWFTLSNQAGYAATYRENLPLASVAARILESAGHARLDYIALGSGDGKQEVRLLQRLLDRCEATPKRAADISLYLLDISQPLLSRAFRHATTELAGRNGVTVWAVQGDFHHLPRYTQLHYSPQRANRRRLVTMFGNTIGNLDNEPTFFRHGLVGLAPGDLLLLDCDLTRAPSDQPDEIRKKDPALQGPIRPELFEWLSGPLHRYCNGCANVSLRYELVTHCPVPGCYCLDALATVQLADGREKVFSVIRAKRYEPSGLVSVLADLGWEPLATHSYGAPDRTPSKCLLLFRKTAAKAR